MSYINNALRKAQRERDGGKFSAGGDISSPTDNTKGRKKKWKLFIIPLAVALFVVPVVVVFNGYYSVGKRGSDDDISRKGQTVHGPLRTISTQAAAQSGREVEGRQPPVTNLYDEAFKAQREGRWREAGILYRQVLSREPQHIHALNNLGVIHMREKRHDLAAELFVKAIAAKQDYVDPYYNLACLYSQQKNAKASLRYLEQAVKINGKVGEWAKDDADFRNVRSLREFKQITEPKR